MNIFVIVLYLDSLTKYKLPIPRQTEALIVIPFYGDNPKISPIYVAKELLDFRVRLAQGADVREGLRYLDH